MKKIVASVLLIGSLFFGTVNIADAGYVSGYTKSNGTYVGGYYRTTADGNPYNNYSFPGNYNPNTGSITGGNVSTYLNNYYNTTSGYTSSYSYPSYTPTYSYPSYSSAPSCPLMSNYNSLTGACTCMSGYVAGKDIFGESSCVSADAKCTDLMGYGAQYDTSANSCECKYGYVQNGSKCVSEISFCSNQLGLMSQYNKTSQKCECMSGYEYNGTSCAYKKTSSSYSQTYNSSVDNCPINSHESPYDSTKCLCNSGYKINSSKTACAFVASATINASAPVITSSLSDQNQTCKKYYGSGVHATGQTSTSGGAVCDCDFGYSWNVGQTSCVVDSKKWCEINNPGLITEVTSYPNGNFSCRCYSAPAPNRATLGCVKQHEN